MSTSNGFAWRGRRACQDVIDATADYEHLTRSSLIGRIFQACYSFAVQSKGSHSGGGALDTVQLSDRKIRAASAIGFWPSNRFKWQGFDGEHAHWNLFGCPHRAPLQDRQEDQLRGGHGGLKSGASDLHLKLRPAKIITYRQWRDSHKPKKATIIKVPATGVKLRDRIMTVAGVNAARKGGKSSIYTYRLQVWLRQTGFYRSPIDAKWGPVTQAALDNFRRSLGWPKADCVGPAGLASVTLLAKKAKSKRIVREK